MYFLFATDRFQIVSRDIGIFSTILYLKSNVCLRLYMVLFYIVTRFIKVVLVLMTKSS